MAILGKNKKRDSSSFDPDSLPPGLLAEAKTKPGAWVYEIDARFDPNGAVPPEGVKGAWKIGDDGVPTGEYQANPRYQPEG